VPSDAAAPGAEGLVASLRRVHGALWIGRVVLFAVALAVAFVVVRLVGKIDWPAVWDALSHLAWWHPLVLVSILLVRMVCNASPLAFYIPGVTVYRATINDLAAHLMSIVAPPPSDLALRVTMFTSWGVPTSQGVAGTVMNTVTYYIVRFATPLAGFVLLLAAGQAPGPRWLELGFILASAAMLVGLVLVMRSDTLAARTGALAARAMRRFRPSVDPGAWAQSCVGFRADMAARFRRGFPLSIAGVTGMIVADLTIVVLCLRFVGVSASEVDLVHIAIAYLFAFPLTVFPFMGLGVVDALLLAALVEAGGLEVEAASVAALVVWRVFTLAGPVLLGTGAVAMWRHSIRGTDAEMLTEQPGQR